MQNKSLGKDYVIRANKRLKALQVLFEEEAWPDVVRESQEVIELALKGLLRLSHIEVPRIHDVSDVLLSHEELLPKGILRDLKELARISKQLRRDRELAFYGSEDLTPSEFYKKADAQEAKKYADWVVKTILACVKL